MERAKKRTGPDLPYGLAIKNALIMQGRWRKGKRGRKC